SPCGSSFRSLRSACSVWRSAQSGDGALTCTPTTLLPKVGVGRSVTLNARRRALNGFACPDGDAISGATMSRPLPNHLSVGVETNCTAPLQLERTMLRLSKLFGVDSLFVPDH